MLFKRLPATRGTVRPPSPVHICTSPLVAPSAHTHTLTLVCARDAQPSCPVHRVWHHHRHHRRRCRRLRGRRAASSRPDVAAPTRARGRLCVCGFRDHGRDPKERVCPLVSCSFAGPCGECLWGAGEPARSTFARICVRLRVVHGDA